MKIDKQFKDFFKKRAPIKAIYGGRMSGKSYSVAGFLIYMAANYKVRILCTRRFQAKITESVYSLLKKLIQEDEYFNPLFEIQERTIKCKRTRSEFIFLGIERNLLDLKGLNDITFTWIEESELLTKEQWETIKPTILREENSTVFLVWNPRYDTDYVYKEFVMNTRKDTITKEINYTDNPFLSDSALELIENDRQHLDKETFNHIYLGYPKSEDETAFIKRSWIEACIDAHIKLNIEIVGEKVLGYDIGDSGTDPCATVERQGILTKNIKEWKAKEDELEQSATKVFDNAEEIRASIVYDCIGVGASAGSTFSRLNNERGKRISYYKFDAGDAVQNPEQEYMVQRKNKDHFENLKAQTWQDIADRMLHTYKAVIKGEDYNPDEIISISSDCNKIEQLKIELSAPRKDKSKRGLVKVESKDDLKKRGIMSPNIADAFIMCYYNNNVINYEDLL